MSAKKQRIVFQSPKGEFTAVANAAKIGAICYERDEAVKEAR